jgi:hypothetical protein
MLRGPTTAVLGPTTLLNSMTTPQSTTQATAGSPSSLRDARRRPHWGWWVAFAMLCVGFASIAAERALHFEDSPIDGPFQLFNALRRLAAGQRFGGTFQFFHGSGIPYLHLIPFEVFGGSFLASEMVRQLLSIVVALSVFALFFRAWIGSWHDGLPIAVVGLVALIPLRVNALLFPINSMLGLRSTMPLLLALHLYLRSDGWRASAERAALFAIAMLCGIEQGSASIAAFIVVKAILAVRRRDGRELLRAAGVVALAGILFVLILFVMTPTGFRSVIEFNFRSLPRDQFWYFGGPPNLFLFSWSQCELFGRYVTWTVLVTGTVAWTLIRFWRGSTRAETRDIAAEAFLALYALASTASMLGTWSIVYLQPAVRVALILALLAARREWASRQDDLHIADDLKRRAPIYAMVAVIGYSIAGYPLATISVVRTPWHILYAHGLLRQPPAMSKDWNSSIQLGEAMVADRRAALHREPTLWSTYASYLEWRMAAFHPSFDYIIHALGAENRSAYAATFVARKPDIVQTLEPTYTNYEEWLEVNHWDFYRPLLRDYDIAAAGPWSYFWFRRPVTFDDRPQMIVDAPVPPGQLAIAIDGRGVAADSIGLFEVTLYYQVVNPWRRVPVIGSLPRYLVHVLGTGNHNAISLAPYARKRVFPVLTMGPTEIHLLGEVRSLVGGATLVFDSIRVDRLSVAPQNRRWAVDFIAGPRKDSLMAKRQ